MYRSGSRHADTDTGNAACTRSDKSGRIATAGYSGTATFNAWTSIVMRRGDGVQRDYV